MRISTPWTGAALFFLTLCSAEIAWSLTHPKTIPAGSIPSHPDAAVAAAHDDAKKSWPDLNYTIVEKPFGVDFATFAGAPEKSFVEFYVQISYDRLSFIRDGKTFRALYDIDFYIEDEQGNLLETQSESDEVTATSYDETTRADRSRLTLLSAGLRPGNYQWRAIITDRENAKNYTAISKFSVRDFSGQDLAVSDLQFSRHIQLDSSRNVFVKNNRRIEPNVPRAYGQFAEQLWVYYEIYHLVEPGRATPDSTLLQTAAADSFQTLYSIRNDIGEEVKQLWKTSRKPGSSCVQSVMLPIANLKSGLYTLTVRVFDNANSRYAESRSRFSVQWDLLSFKARNDEGVIEALRYVASADELKRLKQLPMAERRQGLLAFWQRRDPTPDTPRNEAMEEYYRRLDFVKAHFKWQQGESWKSPQGQTYLIYGPPDNVQRFSANGLNRVNDGFKTPVWSAEMRPDYNTLAAAGRASLFNSQYEIWEYIDLNRRFVFVDVRGIGTYELVDPMVLGTLGLR